MKNWIRVASVFSVLVGSTALFGYWSLNQFDNALNNLSASYIAVTNTPLTSFSDKTNEEQILTAALEITSTTTPEVISTTTPEAISTSATSTPSETPFLTGSTDLKLSFVFPKNNNEFYIGCTYQISLQSSTTIHSFGVALVDAGTEEAAGPIASGLARENKIEPDSQSFNWKVGEVWPGEYFISMSKVNGVEMKTKSEYFTIHKMPQDISVSERENMCKGSGGLLDVSPE
mgnify:CR=1 FL=1